MQRVDIIKYPLRVTQVENFRYLRYVTEWDSSRSLLQVSRVLGTFRPKKKSQHKESVVLRRI